MTIVTYRISRAGAQVGQDLVIAAGDGQRTRLIDDCPDDLEVVAAQLQL